MPQPTSTSIDPTNPAQPRAGKPQRQDDINIILRDIQNRLDRIESILQGGVLLTNTTGTVRRRLTVDGSGNPVYTPV